MKVTQAKAYLLQSDTNQGFLKLLQHAGRMDKLLDKLQKDIVMIMKSVPEVYLDFYRSYFYQPCSLCHKPSMISICLLCGETVCKRFCDKNDNDSPTGNQILTVVGNACKHSFKYHNGTSIFLDCEDSSIYCYENERLCIIQDGFVDKLGNNVFKNEKRYENFGKFKLNKTAITNMLKEYLNFHVLGFIINMAHKHNVSYRRNYY